MVIEAVLFDLDDTLVPEAAAWAEAFDAACDPTARQLDVPVEELRRRVFGSALQLREEGPMIGFCRSLGLGSPSSLLSDVPGEGEELTVLRDRAPTYRRQAWIEGLGEVGFHDPSIAIRLSESFRTAFRTVHRPFDDVPPLLARIRGHRLGVITNGFADLQRMKLGLSGLDRWFEQILISSEEGLGKPDPRFFELALERMGVPPDGCVTVGDGLMRDVKGAAAVGIQAVWLDRGPTPAASNDWQGRRIVSLLELEDVLESLR